MLVYILPYKCLEEEPVGLDALLLRLEDADAVNHSVGLSECVGLSYCGA